MREIRTSGVTGAGQPAERPVPATLLVRSDVDDPPVDTLAVGVKT